MIDLELNPDARALIELARDAHEPGDDDRARVRAVLASRIGVAAGLGLAAGLGAAAHTTTTAGAGVTVGGLGAGAAALKVIGAVVIVSATVAGATLVHRARHAPIARAVVERAPAPEPQRRVASGTAATPETSPPASEPAREETTAYPPDTRAAAVAAKRPPRAHAIVPGSPEVADEASLVHAGVVARRAGEPARALALLDTHARQYPQGVLAEERDVERALALADLGRVTEARAAVDRFLKDHPRSPLAARLMGLARSLDPDHSGARP